MSFTIFDQFAECLALLNDKDRKEVSFAINEYGMYDRTLELRYPLNAMFVLIKDDIDRSKAAQENGKKGGRPRKTRETVSIEALVPEENNQPSANEKTTLSLNEKPKTRQDKLSQVNPGQENKKAYGECQNVLLSDDELQKLKAKFPDYTKRIDNLSLYIASKGDKYKSHYATLLNWSRNETAGKEAKSCGFYSKIK